MQNPDHEFLIALHELVEAYLTKKAGIPEADITNFDINCPDCDPGNHPEAPYHRQHLIATKIEKIMAEELNIDWNRYEEEIDTVMSSWRTNERHP
jgi:hypothetical protein